MMVACRSCHHICKYGYALQIQQRRDKWMPSLRMPAFLTWNTWNLVWGKGLQMMMRMMMMMMITLRRKHLMQMTHPQQRGKLNLLSIEYDRLMLISVKKNWAVSISSSRSIRQTVMHKSHCKGGALRCSEDKQQGSGSSEETEVKADLEQESSDAEEALQERRDSHQHTGTSGNIFCHNIPSKFGVLLSHWQWSMPICYNLFSFWSCDLTLSSDHIVALWVKILVHPSSACKKVMTTNCTTPRQTAVRLEEPVFKDKA